MQQAPRAGAPDGLRRAARTRSRTPARACGRAACAPACRTGACARGPGGAPGSCAADLQPAGVQPTAAGLHPAAPPGVGAAVAAAVAAVAVAAASADPRRSAPGAAVSRLRRLPRFGFGRISGFGRWLSGSGGDYPGSGSGRSGSGDYGDGALVRAVAAAVARASVCWASAPAATSRPSGVGLPLSVA